MTALSEAGTDRSVRLGDIEVAYTAAGSGERPVVLLHGLAEDRRTWAHQQRELGEHRTYAYDLRGHGRTTLGAADGTLAQLGGDLVHFLETVTGPATCVGFSLGGTVALWAAAQRPDLVRHAVVVATSTVVGRAAAGFYDERIASAERGDHAAVTQALRADTAGGMLTPDPTEEVLARRLEAVGDLGGYLNGARAMRGLREEPLTPRLATVPTRVDVVGAEHDTFCPRRAADIILEALPHGRYHEVASAGHLVNADQPDALTAVLRTTLKMED